MNKLLDADIKIRANNTLVTLTKNDKLIEERVIDNKNVKQVVSNLTKNREIDSDMFLRMCKVFDVKGIKIRSKA